ncbi:MAG: S41 family peptidase [Muribaculum sp.]|nr:S41 family peptidase [Muribaculum sp.]
MRHLTAILTLLVYATPILFGQNQQFRWTPDDKLKYAERIISSYYVEEVDRDTIVDEAIKAMLQTLDPHSIYSTPEETRELNEPLSGNFSGIGIKFNLVSTDTLYVIETVSGGPAKKVGILPGDRIIQVDDTIIAGVKMKNSEVMKRLRGPKGTVVNVKVMRKGVPDLIDFAITRDDIPIYSVEAAYMADPTTGYILVTQFGENTPKEFSEALNKLKKQGMKNLIIDLQGNGGGYLNAAYELAANFLKKGDLLVYTDGPRIPTQKYTAEKDGQFPADGRVVVLVDQYSASASEILSGALQDHDRAAIVGRRTFGKGLVQRPFPFPDGSMIRLTVSKYYTPSGRCIQKPYKKGDFEDYTMDILNRYESGEFMHSDSVHVADSLQYTTLRNHRTVYGGGGIMPDKFVPIDTTWYSPYYRNMMAKGIFNKYILNYVDSHREELLKQYPDEQAFIDKFTPSDSFRDGFINMGKESGVEFNEEEFKRSETYINTILKALLASDLYESSTYSRIVNDINPTYKEGLRLINDKKEYERLLGK